MSGNHQSFQFLEWLPSGNLLHSYWNGPFKVDFPIKDGDFNHSFWYVYQRVSWGNHTPNLINDRVFHEEFLSRTPYRRYCKRQGNVNPFPYEIPAENLDLHITWHWCFMEVFQNGEYPKSKSWIAKVFSLGPTWIRLDLGTHDQQEIPWNPHFRITKCSRSRCFSWCWC